jgi:Tfp pilus assembly protein PilV
MKLRAGRARPTDAGESLVELLVSIAIFGVAVLAILGALTMSASSSSLHEGQAKAQNALRNWAEQISGATYVECASAAQIATAATVPSGGSVGAVRYWSTSAKSFSGTCSNSGLQQVTLNYSAPSSLGAFTQSLDVIIRKPCLTVSSC